MALIDDAQRGHVGQIGTFAAQQITHLSGSFGDAASEEIDELLDAVGVTALVVLHKQTFLISGETGWTALPDCPMQS